MTPKNQSVTYKIKYAQRNVDTSQLCAQDNDDRFWYNVKHKL